MMGLGVTEGLILLAIVVLMFGGKKIPELGKSMGQAITGFKKGLKEENKDPIEDKSDKNKNA